MPMDYAHFRYIKLGLKGAKQLLHRYLSTLLPPAVKQNLGSPFDNHLSLSILLLAKKGSQGGTVI